MKNYVGLKPGTRLRARDLRVFVLLQYDGDYMELQYGPSPDQRSWWRVDGSAEEGEVTDADVVAVAYSCRECEHFRYPEPSRIYDNETVSRYCPYSNHIWSDGRTYCIGGQLSCSHFSPKVQLELF